MYLNIDSPQSNASQKYKEYVKSKRIKSKSKTKLEQYKSEQPYAIRTKADSKGTRTKKGSPFKSISPSEKLLKRKATESVIQDNVKEKNIIVKESSRTNLDLEMM